MRTTQQLNLRSGNYSIEKHHYENVGLKERMVSILLGGLLIGTSWKNPLKNRALYGAYLAYRGFSGRCMVYDSLGIDGKRPQAVNIRGEFDIDLPPAEVYSYWRNLKNLPGALSKLLNVEVVDEHLSNWRSAAIGDLISIKWQAEIVKDEPGHLIGWRSVSGSFLHHVGRVEFDPIDGGQRTLMKIVLSYRPLVGGIGYGISKMINPYFEHLLKKEIKNFKYKIEHQTPVAM